MSRYRSTPEPTDFVRVASRADVPAGTMRCVEVDGRQVALVNLDGELYALDSNCPHNGGPLARGTFNAAQGTVICPWHAWTWSVRDGRAVTPPVAFRATTYPVRLEGDDILVSRNPG